MPLSEMEEARLQKFIDDLHFSKDQESRIRDIAVKSKDQVPLKVILKEAGSDWYFVTENRMKMRRRGVW